MLYAAVRKPGRVDFKNAAPQHQRLPVVHWAAVVLLLLASGVAAASAEQGEAAPIFRAGSGVASVLAAHLDTAHEPQLAGERNALGLGFVFSGDLAAYDWLGLDLEVHFLYREFDTPVAAPLFGTIDNDTTIGTTAILFGARAHHSLHTALRAYAVAGLGYYYTTLSVSGSVFGFPGTYEDTDQTLGLYYGAGLNYGLPSLILSLDYRHLDFSGSFGKFGISGAALGGDLIALGIGWRF